MSNYNSLKATINANIKTNGNQEITGSVLNSVLNAMVNTIGAGYMFAGVAATSTNPGSPDARVFYLATTAGTYSHFGGIVLSDGEVAILKWDSTWQKEVTGIASNAVIEDLESQLEDLSNIIGSVETIEVRLSATWVQGSININTGQNAASTATIRSGFLSFTPGSKLHVVCATGYFIKAIFAYNTADLNDYDTLVLYSYDPETSTFDTSVTDVILNPNGKVLRICVGKTNLGTIAASEGSNISVYERRQGRSEDIVTSLNRIDEEIDEIDQTLEDAEITPLLFIPGNQITPLNYSIRIDTNVWTSLTGYQCGLIDVSAYRGQDLEIISRGGYYCFLTNNTTSGTPSYAAGYSLPVAMVSGSDIWVTIPNNASFLYVMVTNNSVNVAPDSITIGKTLKDKVDELGGINTIQVVANRITPNTSGKYIDPSGVEQNASIYTLISKIPVVQGDVFRYVGYVGSAGVCAAGYNAQGNFVSVLQTYGDHVDGINITIPSGIAFASFCGRIDNYPFDVRRFAGTDTIQGFSELVSPSVVGKRLHVIGDSITEGIVGNGTAPVEPWAVIVAKALKMQLTNYGISASSIAVAAGNGGMYASLADLQAATKVSGMYYTVLTGNQTFQVYYWNGSSLSTSTRKLRTPIVQRYSFMSNDADVVIVAGGTNDFQYNWTDVGTMADRTEDTFYGAMHLLCAGLLQKYLGKTIIFCTPIKRAQTSLDNSADTTAHKGGSYGSVDSQNLFGKTLGDYSNIIKEVCAYYSIPVIDMYSNSLLNPSLASQASLFDSVKTHPYQEGHNMMARYIIGQLKAICG